MIGDVGARFISALEARHIVPLLYPAFFFALLAAAFFFALLAAAPLAAQTPNALWPKLRRPLRLILLLFLFCSLSAERVAGQTPTIVNASRNIATNLSGLNNATTTGCNLGTQTAETDYFWCLADPSVAGNAIIVACGWSDNTATLTISDDKSNTYTSFVGPSRHASGQDIQIFVASNAAAGAHQLDAHFSAASSIIQCVAYQFFNIVSSSPSCGTAVSATSAGAATVNAGNITSSTTNCLYFQFAEEDGGVQPTWTAGTGYTLGDASIRESEAAQFQVFSTAASHPCSMTISSSSKWNTACIALKPATQGGDATTPVVIRGLTLNPMEDSLTSYTFQTPCQSGLMVAASNMDAGAPVTAISSTSPTVTWNEVGAPGVSNTEGSQEIFFAAATFTSSTSTTVTTTAAATHSDIAFYCISGASSSQPDSGLATGTGNVSSFTSPVATASITPNSNQGVIIGTVGIAQNGSTSCDPTGFQDNQDNNNNWCHFYYTSAGTRNFDIVVDQRSAAGGIGAWSAGYVAFKSATATSPGGGQKRRKLELLDENLAARIF